MSSTLLPLVIYTANILGIFNDPFEFAGDYGPEINPIREEVFELVVSREAIAKAHTDLEIRQLMHSAHAQQSIQNYRKFLLEEAIEEEKNFGPTVGELTDGFIEELKKKQQLLGTGNFTEADLNALLHFIEKYKDQKIFRFLRNNPSALLGLDKALRDRAAREGKPFDLPILGSTKPLDAQDAPTLKKNLMDVVFTAKNFSLTKPQNTLKEAVDQFGEEELKKFLGEQAELKDLEAFCSSSGQLFFYWMYQALNLDLIARRPHLVVQINKVKKVFAQILGDSHARAQTLKDQLKAGNTDILFTQECDAILVQTLTEDGLFLPVKQQNAQDGTLVFLRRASWEDDYSLIPIESYDGFNKGRINLLLAKRKQTGEPFLLASCHGHSTQAEDGRMQLTLIMDRWEHLKPQVKGDLQLLIGTDANTKTKVDVKLFQQHLNSLKLLGTHVGPTTIKKRMVSAQHAKVGKMAIDEEDYLITLKPEIGGQYTFTQETVGFKKPPADTKKPLPNIENQSDHYPVGVVAVPIEKR